MSNVPFGVAAFYGQVDKRAKGRYWADAPTESPKAPMRGPFDTKEQAVENALHNPREAATGEQGERGAA